MTFLNFITGFFVILGLGSISAGLEVTKTKVAQIAHMLFLIFSTTFMSFAVGKFILEVVI